MSKPKDLAPSAMDFVSSYSKANVDASATENRATDKVAGEMKCTDESQPKTIEREADDETDHIKKKRKTNSRRTKQERHKLAQAIQIIQKPREYMNHTYYDFSGVPEEDGDQRFPRNIDDMSFNQKIYHILSQDEYSKWMSWLPHGRSFRVEVPVAFEREICQTFFGHKRYSSFLRQLNNHGFKHITAGKDRNSYYHEVRIPQHNFHCVCAASLFRLAVDFST
jgi:hypothetical protein